MEPPNLLSNEEWLSVVKQQLKVTTGVTLLSVIFGKINEHVSGFLGDHLQVEVIVQLSDPSSTKKLHFFVKRLPTDNSFHTEFVLSSNAFGKETGFYSVIVEKYKKYGLIPDGVLAQPWAPECYFTRPDLLVQENLLVQGFQLFKNENFMDYAHCQLVLKSLSSLHATSFILEESISKEEGTKCSLNKLFPNILAENIFICDGESELKLWYQSTIKALLYGISMLPKYGKGTEVFKQIQETFQEKCEKMYEYAKPSNKYRNVISHGDLWNNNILFRYDEEQNIPKDVRFVDFQLTRFTPPAFDVMMFLHLTTSRAFRVANLDRLLSVYHKGLSKELLRHGCDVDQLLPWTEFRESCQYYSTTSRIVAPSYHHINQMPGGLATEHLGSKETFQVFFMEDRNATILECFNKYPKYRARISEELEELIECVVLETEMK